MSAGGAVLITGATSGIGCAIARLLAAEGRSLVLASRDAAELDRWASDFRVRYDADVVTRVYDARTVDTATFLDACAEAASGGLAGVIVCHGYLGSQALAQRDPDEARAIMDVNFTSCVNLLNAAATHLLARGAGFLCAVSSVAGDRGRQSNHVYGSAKAGLNTFLDGLRHRLAGTPVSVTTIKPGFVDTPMTYGLTDSKLNADRERVAEAIWRATRRGRSVVYVPWFWRYIMLIIRAIPGPIFRRTKL
ncbi:MAG: SDR family oxidoreductase [Planctomycetes bacterium]|nr:SDR family oxidoreductase [Planctomycetota bacterium]